MNLICHLCNLFSWTSVSHCFQAIIVRNLCEVSYWTHFGLGQPTCPRIDTYLLDNVYVRHPQCISLPCAFVLTLSPCNVTGNKRHLSTLDILLPAAAPVWPRSDSHAGCGVLWDSHCRRGGLLCLHIQRGQPREWPEGAGAWVTLAAYTVQRQLAEISDFYRNIITLACLCGFPFLTFFYPSPRKAYFFMQNPAKKLFQRHQGKDAP